MADTASVVIIQANHYKPAIVNKPCTETEIIFGMQYKTWV